MPHKKEKFRTSRSPLTQAGPNTTEERIMHALPPWDSVRGIVSRLLLFSSVGNYSKILLLIV